LLVADTRKRYGITDDDTYNFDETGFVIGLAMPSASKAVSIASVGRATTIQPGNREWVTGIETINALGWSIPPFIILAGKVHQNIWQEINPDLPPE